MKILKYAILNISLSIINFTVQIFRASGITIDLTNVGTKFRVPQLSLLPSEADLFYDHM